MSDKNQPKPAADDDAPPPRKVMRNVPKGVMAMVANAMAFAPKPKSFVPEYERLGERAGLKNLTVQEHSAMNQASFWRVRRPISQELAVFLTDRLDLARGSGLKLGDYFDTENYTTLVELRQAYQVAGKDVPKVVDDLCDELRGLKGRKDKTLKQEFKATMLPVDARLGDGEEGAPGLVRGVSFASNTRGGLDSLDHRCKQVYGKKFGLSALLAPVFAVINNWDMTPAALIDKLLDGPHWKSGRIPEAQQDEATSESSASGSKAAAESSGAAKASPVKEKARSKELARKSTGVGSKVAAAQKDAGEEGSESDSSKRKAQGTGGGPAQKKLKPVPAVVAVARPAATAAVGPVGAKPAAIAAGAAAAASKGDDESEVEVLVGTEWVPAAEAPIVGSQGVWSFPSAWSMVQPGDMSKGIIGYSADGVPRIVYPEEMWAIVNPADVRGYGVVSKGVDKKTHLVFPPSEEEVKVKQEKVTPDSVGSQVVSPAQAAQAAAAAEKERQIAAQVALADSEELRQEMQERIRRMGQ